MERDLTQRDSESTTDERGDRSFPRRALMATILLTLAIFAVETWVGWTTYAAARSLATTELRLRDLAGTIMRLDEVLTMSARMSAATGDPKWEERYSSHEDALDQAIKESLRLAPEAYMGAWAAETDDANARLVDMEKRSFALVRSGDRDAAAVLLFSAEYEAQKRIYAAGMTKTVSAIERRSAGELRRLARRAVFVLVCSLLMLGALAVCWARITQLIRRYLGARDVAEGRLKRANETLENRVVERTRDLSVANEKLTASLEELRATQQRLVEASRRVGMADVATSVLHNVGNVLNSVNVSTDVALNVVRSSKGLSLGKAVALLQRQPDRAAFLAHDPRGKKLVEYFGAVALALDEERVKLTDELTGLARHVEHIKVIVSKQQAHAKVGAVAERLRLATLVDDALALNAGAADQHTIEVLREYEEIGMVETDRHKLFDVIVNLVANARQALRDCQSDRRLTVRVRAGGERGADIEVEDNGSGIEPGNMPRLFTHGFTTKADGHGFGLHSAACAVIELGGQLRAFSGGVGRGAKFIVSLPASRQPIDAARAA